ncbi:MAG: hypothetical protein P8N30_02200 [Tateyamaria sp.]|nr:hypothetical protein [Tateyamaria sp.]
MTSDVNKYDDYSDQFILVPVQENMVGVEENFQLFEIDPGGQDVVDVDPDNDIAIRDRELIGTEIRGTVIPPFLMGVSCRIHAAVFSFIAGVMPPMAMLGRSLL